MNFRLCIRSVHTGDKVEFDTFDFVVDDEDERAESDFVTSLRALGCRGSHESGSDQCTAHNAAPFELDRAAYRKPIAAATSVV